MFAHNLQESDNRTLSRLADVVQDCFGKSGSLSCLHPRADCEPLPCLALEGMISDKALGIETPAARAEEKLIVHFHILNGIKSC